MRAAHNGPIDVLHPYPTFVHDLINPREIELILNNNFFISSSSSFICLCRTAKMFWANIFFSPIHNSRSSWSQMLLRSQSCRTWDELPSRGCDFGFGHTEKYRDMQCHGICLVIALGHAHNNNTITSTHSLPSVLLLNPCCCAVLLQSKPWQIEAKRSHSVSSTRTRIKWKIAWVWADNVRTALDALMQHAHTAHRVPVCAAVIIPNYISHILF